MSIADSERIDPLAVCGAEPALEVRAPDSVRAMGMRQRLSVGSRSDALASRYHQPFPPEHRSHRAGRWPRPSGLVAIEDPLELPWSPSHVRLPQFQHYALYLGRCLVGMP